MTPRSRRIRRIGLAAVVIVVAGIGLPVLVVNHLRSDPSWSVEGCDSYVAKHSATVLAEARRIAGPGSDLSYLADCSSYDTGGAEGDVVDPPATIEARMRDLGSVSAKQDEGCVEYLLPEDPTASCDYFEYRPRGSELTFNVTMPDEVEQVFLVRIKE